MSGHHHDHDGHGHCHGEDHDHSNDITPAIQSLLYSQIDFGQITTLNGILIPSNSQASITTNLHLTESVPKAGAAIAQKTWAERLNDKPELESDADEQLLMNIP
jgi:ABC-type Zn2+ transport system substrate-binding protein/surface adhesin